MAFRHERSIKSTFNKKRPALYNIVGELKYRGLYISLATISLLLLSYLNIGLYLEFQGSYYLNYYQFIDFNWAEGIKELNHNIKYLKEAGTELSNEKYSFDNNCQALPQQSSLVIFENPKNQRYIYESIVVEIDEFKNFFLSITNYFSGQTKFVIDLHQNKTQNIFDRKKISQQLIFSIYFMSLFYQLASFLGYHCFCFLCPAITKKNRLKLIKLLQAFFIILLLHFLTLPYVIAIYQELQIENLDSELFFSSQFGFLEDWIRCFYFLLVAVILLFVFILYFYYS